VSRGRKRKYAMFERGATAFRAITGATEALYPCPICGVLLPQEAIDAGELTEEHAPPRALGGRPLALVCRPCNSLAGHTIDAALNDLQDLTRLSKAMFSRTEPYSRVARLKIGDFEVNAEIRVSEPGGAFEIHVLESRNNPAHFEAQLAHLESVRARGAGAIQMNLTGRGPHLWRSQVGAIKAAYIVAFAAFGYTFLSQRAMAVVREQIRRPEERIIEGAVVLSDPSIRNRNMLWLMEEPFNALAVSFNIVTVLLPRPESPHDLYEQVRTLIKGEAGVPFSGSPLTWPNKMLLRFDQPRAA
jgi:hypothetical protein